MSDDVLQGVLVFHVALVMLERESSFVLIFNSLIAVSLLSLSLSLSLCRSISTPCLCPFPSLYSGGR